MSTETVSRDATNQRIVRAVRAAMGARDVKDDKQLASLSGIKYDTLLRRLNGKPWLAEEILAVAVALDVDVRVLLESDPDDWFRRDELKQQPAGYRPAHPRVLLVA